MSEATADSWKPEWSDDSASGDRESFQRLAEPHRREIQLHCYRFMGSLQDAEDLTQETLLRAWRGFERFEGRASFRNWLYRIATNTCLNALAKRATVSRVLPESYGPPTVALPEGAASLDVPWLDPYPDLWLEGLPDSAPGPDARFELHESVTLAFVAAIQMLPPRQRAVLLLRDVLGWSASESAELLDTSVASANSALQRARTTLEKNFPKGEPMSLPMPDDQQRALLDRFVRAWESTNIDDFVAVLRDDATLSMPPQPHWYQGREAIASFFRWVWAKHHAETEYAGNMYRLVMTAANRQPAFAMYRVDESGSLWYAQGVQVLSITSGQISNLTVFRDPRLVAAFRLPVALR